MKLHGQEKNVAKYKSKIYDRTLDKKFFEKKFVSFKTMPLGTKTWHILRRWCPKRYMLKNGDEKGQTPPRSGSTAPRSKILLSESRAPLIIPSSVSTAPQLGGRSMALRSSHSGPLSEPQALLRPRILPQGLYPLSAPPLPALPRSALPRSVPPRSVLPLFPSQPMPLRPALLAPLHLVSRNHPKRFPSQLMSPRPAPLA